MLNFEEKMTDQFYSSIEELLTKVQKAQEHLRQATNILISVECIQKSIQENDNENENENENEKYCDLKASVRRTRYWRRRGRSSFLYTPNNSSCYLFSRSATPRRLKPRQLPTAYRRTIPRQLRNVVRFKERSVARGITLRKRKGFGGDPFRVDVRKP